MVLLLLLLLPAMRNIRLCWVQHLLLDSAQPWLAGCRLLLQLLLLLLLLPLMQEVPFVVHAVEAPACRRCWWICHIIRCLLPAGLLGTAGFVAAVLCVHHHHSFPADEKVGLLCLCVTESRQWETNSNHSSMVHTTGQGMTHDACGHGDAPGG